MNLTLPTPARVIADRRLVDVALNNLQRTYDTMKIHRLIEILKNAKQEHGNLEVVIYDRHGERIQKPLADLLVTSNGDRIHFAERDAAIS